MDKIDFEIIQILFKDARTPFNRISKQLGVSIDSVFSRYERLKREGIITGSTVVLSSEACGFLGYCDFFIKVKSGSSIKDVFEELRKLKISSICQLLGEYDFNVEVFFRDIADIYSMHESLRLIKGISAADLLVYAETDSEIPFFDLYSEGLPSWLFEISER
jgi:Lrp/AsnC family transcriptional regulator for asnA, asnC and gidA